jgi:hypothetical protein
MIQLPPAPQQQDMMERIFRAWWFDPLVATLSFTVFIHIYWYEERKRGLSSNSTFAETVGFGWGPLYNSLAAYWLGIYLLQCLIDTTPLQQVVLNLHRPDGIPHNGMDVIYLLTEIVSGVIVYDALMFVLHWAMHEISYCHRWHVRHHSHKKIVESRDTLRHSLLDGSLQVLCNILSQQVSPPYGQAKSRLARALHNIVVIWMLTESHTRSPYPNVWRRWCMGVAHHYRHHHHRKHCRLQKRNSSDDNDNGAMDTMDRYQQFFGYLDDARIWYYNKKK